MKKIFTMSAEEFYKEQEKRDIEEVYKEDTVGKKIHSHIVSPTKTTYKDPLPAETLSFNLHTLIDRKTFLKLSTEAKKKYILSIREKFDIPDKEIAKAIGISKSCLSRYVVEAGIGRRSGYSSSYMKPETEAAWNDFVNGNAIKVEEAPQPAPVCDQQDIAPVVPQENHTCSSLELKFNGTPNLVGFVELAEKMFGSLNDCDVTITITRR